MVIHIVAYVLLTILPGAWITFGLPLKGLSFWIKLLIGIILTPVVVAAQFYLLRLATLPFVPTSIALVVLNLPALYLIYRAREPFPHLDKKAVIAAGVIALVVLVAIAPFLLDPQKRIYTWEALSQSDVVYAFSNGQLDLQEPEMVGYRLSYPWAGQVYQAASSYVSDSPPMSNYIWGNLIWLVCIFGLAAAVTGELSGNAFSQVTTAVWLSFGVNIVGTVAQPLIPADWSKAHRTLKYIWGDNRYSPWLDKIAFFGQVYFSLGIYIAIIYLLLRKWPESSRKGYYALIAILMTGLCLIYPVLMPAAALVIGGRMLLDLIHWVKARDRSSMEEFLVLVVVCVFSLALTYLYSRFLTGARSSASLFSVHEPRILFYRTLESIVVTSPLLVGMLIAFRRVLRSHPDSLTILGLGYLGCMFAYTAFDIPWWHNEYKYVLTAAICIAPFLGLALEPVFSRLGRFAIPALFVITLLMAEPFFQDIYSNIYGNYTRHGALADVSSFSMRLADSEPLSSLVDTIRMKTPQNSLVLVGEASFYYPALTQRQLYAPPDQQDPYPGIEVSSTEMITLVKGLPAATLADRRAILYQLYNATNPVSALAAIQAYHRPLVLVVNEQKDAALLQWLEKVKIGQQIFNANGYRLWLIQPGEKPS